MARFEGKEIARAFREAFGVDVEQATPAQVMFLVRFSKHVRRFCRSNPALHNSLKRSFPHLRIYTEKVASKFPGKPFYDALRITDPDKRMAVQVAATLSNADAVEQDDESGE